jgi:hypothetical protein
MSELIAVTNKLPANMAALFAPELNNDLTANVGSSFPILSIKGSKWAVRYSGDTEPMLNAEGDSVPAIQVVILQSNPNVTKTYYKGKYEEGDDAQPDCASCDGKTPDKGVENPVAKSCEGCPMNAWGSRITESGKDGKACQDSRRVAVLSAGDLKSDVFDGNPLLLRVPATSLKELSAYSRQLSAQGLSYKAVVTKVSFDPEAAYPKLMFKAVRALNEEELMSVVEHIKGETYKPLFEGVDIVSSNNDGKKPAAKKAATKKPAAKKATTKKPAPEPVEVEAEPEVVEAEPVEEKTEVASSDLDDELASILDGLD